MTAGYFLYAATGLLLSTPTSNHYGDSIIGFGITIFIWAFALAAIYKSTKSVIACALYHAFIDTIGAVYDWNALFDGFPGNVSTNVYRGIWLCPMAFGRKKVKHAAL